MSVSKDFQSKLTDLVEDLDCLKSAIPEKLGMNYTTFTKAINYGIIPTPKILMRIADYFDISIEYLLSRTNDPHFEKTENPLPFIIRLEELRGSKNLTYYEIAKRLHIGTNYFSEWKKNNYLPTLNNLILLADFFDVTLDYLLGRTDYK